MQDRAKDDHRRRARGRSEQWQGALVLGRHGHARGRQGDREGPLEQAARAESARRRSARSSSQQLAEPRRRRSRPRRGAGARNGERPGRGMGGGMEWRGRGGAAAAPAGRTIRVAISLDPALAGKLKPGTPLFVAARAARHSRAAARGRAPVERPAADDRGAERRQLDDRGPQPSSVDDVEIVARVAFGGTAVPATGDLLGTAVQNEGRAGRRERRRSTRSHPSPWRRPSTCASSKLPTGLASYPRVLLTKRPPVTEVDGAAGIQGQRLGRDAAAAERREVRGCLRIRARGVPPTYPHVLAMPLHLEIFACGVVPAAADGPDPPVERHRGARRAAPRHAPRLRRSRLATTGGRTPGLAFDMATEVAQRGPARVARDLRVPVALAGVRRSARGGRPPRPPKAPKDATVLARARRHAAARRGTTRACRATTTRST